MLHDDIQYIALKKSSDLVSISGHNFIVMIALCCKKY